MFALATPTAILAEDPPVMTIFVFGEVTIDGSSASGGTVSVEGVSVEIGSDGKYSIEILSENMGKDYKVNGNSATKTPIDSTSSWKKINLSITTPEDSTPTPAPSSGGVGGTPSSSTSHPNPPAVEEDDEEEPVISEEEENVEKKEEVIVLGIETDYRAIQINKIINEASSVWTGDANTVSANMGANRDPKAEVSGYNKYTSALIRGMDGLEQSNIYSITNFVVYGTPTTEILGAGERAGALNSYKAAFGKLPATESEWQDIIKIANGRWPNERSEATEAKAKQEFKKVYLREPDMDNPNDNAAVTVIAYGLRPDARNLDSEKAGISTFKHIYGYNPVSAIDWDIVRAIAYSGAVR